MPADPITAACHLDYLPAYHSSGQRRTDQIWWIVLHDEEAPTAQGAAEYFRTAASGGSAHLCVDDNTCYRCLNNDTTPWGAASSFGANQHGFHIEQAGFASWPAARWKQHDRMLRRAAYKTALHCKAFRVPVQFVAAKDLPRKHGITTHAEVSAASRRLDPKNAAAYSHTDPGKGWPQAYFIDLVKHYHAAL